MNFYLISDTHFGHERLKLPWYCDRPDNFEFKILKNIAKTVTKDDILIHLGDFCFHREEYWHEMLLYHCLGKKWLIRGNHDGKSVKWYLEHGWDSVGDRLTLNIFGKSILFSHVPVEDLGKHDVNIHGHLHNNDHHPECVTHDKHILVKCEHDYMPVSLRRLVEK